MTTDSRLARMIDDHVTGRYHPDAPFNQVDQLWECVDCPWVGEDVIEDVSLETSEFWGEVASTQSVGYKCPKCGGDAAEHNPLEDEGEEEDPEWEDEDEEDFIDELNDDEEDPL